MLGCAYSLVLAIYWLELTGQQQAVATALLIPLLWLSVVDLQQQIIPDSAAAFVALIGLMNVVFLQSDSDISIELVGAAVVFCFFWFLGEVYWRRTKVDGLGIGDAKLIAAGSLCVGLSNLWLLILLASLGGLILIAVVFAASRTLQRGLPFGPFLAFSIFLVFLLGTQQ